MLKATQQQEACIAAAKQHDGVVIEACAGAAKTTTLVMIANEIEEPSLYWAFNKAAATEGNERFPSHVQCRTQHSLAYASFGNQMAHKLSRPKGYYKNVGGTGSEIAKLYQLNGQPGIITAAGVGQLVKATVAAFEQSADDKMTQEHLPMYDIKKFIEKGAKNLTPTVFDAARKLWKDRTNLEKDVLATHDTYLKLFQLSKPTLNFTRIYLDEAQDTTPCVLDIFLRQTQAKLVMVGDSRQNIYGWRGSINAMGMVPFNKQQLGQSFRYGQNVANVAMDVLKGKLDIKGFDKVNSIAGQGVVDRTKPYTILYRGNATLLADAVLALEEGQKIAIEIDVRDFVKLLESAQALFDRDLAKVKHERIIPYPDWESMKADFEEDGELKRVGEIIAGYKGRTMIRLLNQYTVPDNPHVIFTTSHKAKGREWDQVVLAEDFPSHYAKDGTYKGLPESEENLLYVAVTRAKKVLDINSTVTEAIEYMASHGDTEETWIERLGRYGQGGEQAGYANEQLENYQGVDYELPF